MNTADAVRRLGASVAEERQQQPNAHRKRAETEDE